MKLDFTNEDDDERESVRFYGTRCDKESFFFFCFLSLCLRLKSGV